MLDKVTRQKLVVIGNGMAGIRTIEELLARAPHLYDVTVFGSEPYGNYNRILLSPVLAGEKAVPDIMLNDDAWYDDNGVTLHKGKTVVKIDRAVASVADDGTVAPYDRLLIATGSLPFMLPIPGADLDGVVAFAISKTSIRCWRRRRATSEPSSSAVAFSDWRRPAAS